MRGGTCRGILYNYDKQLETSVLPHFLSVGSCNQHIIFTKDSSQSLIIFTDQLPKAISTHGLLRYNAQSLLAFGAGNGAVN